MKAKFCRDCKYYWRGETNRYCESDAVKEFVQFDPVSGLKRHRNGAMTADQGRAPGGRCGPQAIFFKRTLFGWLRYPWLPTIGKEGTTL